MALKSNATLRMSAPRRSIVCEPTGVAVEPKCLIGIKAATGRKLISHQVEGHVIRYKHTPTNTIMRRATKTFVRP